LNKRDMLRPKPVPPRGILHRRSDAPLTGYARYWPDDDLLPFVEHLWTVEWDLEQSRTSEVLTHPSVQLVVARGESRVAGVFTRRFITTMQGRGRVLGVKFLPGAFRGFLGQPVSRLRDRMVPLAAMFGEAAARLEEEALAHADHSAAFAPIQELVRGHAPAPDPIVAELGQIASRIAADREITQVEQVVAEFGIPLRRLQRLFADYVGVGPKWVIQRYRLHEAAERIAAGEVADFAGLALELGYADQAHFIRDFRKLVGKSPADYARSL
jgi:AraC-like DNA-binding protein